MENVLEELLNLPGVQGTFVVGKDGLVIANVGETDGDAETLGAAAAELANQLESTFKNRGNLKVLEYAGDQGDCYLAAINEVTYLYVQAKTSSNPGRLRLGLKAACQQLREQL